MTDTLKPCPFCASNDIEYNSDDFDGTDFVITCRDCGIFFPWYLVHDIVNKEYGYPKGDGGHSKARYKKAALKLWNRRDLK